MKKSSLFLTTTLSLTLLCSNLCTFDFISANAASTSNTQSVYSTINWNTINGETKINTIGKKILNANGLPTAVTFKLVDDSEVNAFADANNQITVNKGLLTYIENDDELAGILSHEIAHIAKSHCYKQSFLEAFLSYFSGQIKQENLALGAQIASELTAAKVSRNQEYDADYTSVDLINKAGYNPLAMISVLNKISSNYIDIIENHPSGSNRTMALYDYINYNYSTKIKSGFPTTAYNSFLTYATPTINARKSDAKLQAKYEKKQAKLKAKRIKEATKMSRQTDPWAATYYTIEMLSQPTTADNSTSTSASQ